MLDKNRNSEGWICFLIFVNGKVDSFKIEGVISDENWILEVVDIVLRIVILISWDWDKCFYWSWMVGLR